jgi:L-lactate dehydrogenase
MKIGIVGTGTVGCACAMAAVNRGSARQIVLVNRTRKTAEAVATAICAMGRRLGRKSRSSTAITTRWQAPAS